MYGFSEMLPFTEDEDILTLVGTLGFFASFCQSSYSAKIRSKHVSPL